MIGVATLLLFNNHHLGGFLYYGGTYYYFKLNILKIGVNLRKYCSADYVCFLRLLPFSNL